MSNTASGYSALREKDAATENLDSHSYVRPTATDSRSPCPALNTLANHGYLPHKGTHITFLALIHSVSSLYNLTYTLSTLLALAGLLSSGRISRIPADPNASLLKRVTSYIIPRWTLDLSALSKRTGFFHIAHDGALVHPDGRPSTSPDPELLNALLTSPHTTTSDKEGFTIADLARFHAGRRRSLREPLDKYHKEIACGECGLLWIVMGEHVDAERSDLGAIVPLQRVRQWLGEERLPDGWVRPVKPVGLREGSKRNALVKKIEEEEGVF